MFWEAIFWAAAGLIVYTYAGYPVLLALFSRCTRRRMPGELASRQTAELPFVSLVIAAYKEEDVILQRIENALRLDYPADRLEIIIGCDGQEDATGELVATVDDPRVRLVQFPVRRGKPSVLNDCVAASRGEILAFSDANTFWDRDALLRLVRPLQSETVGGVCGQLLLVDPHTGANVDGMYWRYENFLKRHEGRIGALLGCNGAIYAMKRALWEPIPPQTIVDDFLIGMRLHQHGAALLFDEQALAHEESAPTMAAEFHRRSRIGAGGFQSLCWLLPLLNPLRGRIAWAFWSHKVLRWCCPAFMVLALTASVILAAQPVYCGLLVAQLAFYLLAALGHFLPARGPAGRVLRLSSLFVEVNAALAVGFWRWTSQRQSGVWKRTERSREAAAQAVS